MSSADGYSANVFSLFVGALGVLTVVPLIWSVIQSQLPPAKFTRLEQTLVDTETLLHSIIEEGLQFREIPHYESYLNKFRSCTERIREETYRATTFWQQVGAWMDGLSSRIGVLCDEVLEVRINICERSAEARAQLAAGDEDALPARRGLLARMGHSLRRIFAFVYRKKTTVAEPAATPENVNVRSELAAPACAQAIQPESVARPTASSSPIQCIEERRRNASAAPTAGTVPARKRMRRVLHAMGRLEQEMNPRRVRNAALRKVMQAAKRQRSSLSIAKSSQPRRSRKAHGLLVPSGTATRLVLFSQACDSEDESDAELWEDQRVVLGKNHPIV